MTPNKQSPEERARELMDRIKMYPFENSVKELTTLITKADVLDEVKDFPETLTPEISEVLELLTYHTAPLARAYREGYMSFTNPQI